MRRLSFVFPFVVSLALAACSSATEPVQPPKQITALPRILSADEQLVIAANNRFGFRLLQAVSAGASGANVFLSPLSASMALGMTMNGAAGQTQDEMRTALGFGTQSMERIDASYESLVPMLRALDPKVDIRIANALFARTGFPFEPAFIALVQQRFAAQATTLDFSAPGALATINGWADRNTNGKIPKVLDSIDSSIVMLLMNAVYFKGSWTTRFPAAKTKDDVFTTSQRALVPVRMMETETTARLAILPDLTALDLPYGGQAYSMTVLLPTQTTSAAQIVATLTDARWDSIVGRLTPTKVRVQLPKFRLSYSGQLAAPLQSLGMRQAFVPLGADFTAMSSTRGHELFIDFVKHDTFIDVNEEGTEAAAVTTVGIGTTSAGAPPVLVRVDRPFVLAIRERLSGTVLFLGLIERP